MKTRIKVLNSLIGEVGTFKILKKGIAAEVIKKGLAENADLPEIQLFEDNAKKKVLFLTKKDFAGSGLKLVNAINRHSQHYQARMIAEEVANFGAENDLIANDYRVKKNIKDFIKSADIIHLKGDFPPSKYPKEINKKPIVVTVGGSNYRPKTQDTPKQIATGKFIRPMFNGTTFTGITLDLCEDKSEWLPHAFDQFKKVWKAPKDKIIIAHSPSNRAKKGTEIIIEAVKKSGHELLLIENVSNEKCLKLKASAHIFIDQIICKAYGMNAVEAMAMGVPVISSTAKISGCPIYNVEKPTVDCVLEQIKKAVADLKPQTSDKFYKYAEKTHSEKAIVKILEQKYATTHP